MRVCLCDVNKKNLLACMRFIWNLNFVLDFMLCANGDQLLLKESQEKEAEEKPHKNQCGNTAIKCND